VFPRSLSNSKRASFGRAYRFSLSFSKTSLSCSKSSLTNRPLLMVKSLRRDSFQFCRFLSYQPRYSAVTCTIHLNPRLLLRLASTVRIYAAAFFLERNTFLAFSTFRCGGARVLAVPGFCRAPPHANGREMVKSYTCGVFFFLRLSRSALPSPPLLSMSFFNHSFYNFVGPSSFYGDW